MIIIILIIITIIICASLWLNTESVCTFDLQCVFVHVHVWVSSSGWDPDLLTFACLISSLSLQLSSVSSSHMHLCKHVSDCLHSCKAVL